MMKQLLLLILAFAMSVSVVGAQHLKLDERLPSIDVDSTVGSDLKLVDRAYTCIIFMHSESRPSVDAIREFSNMALSLRGHLAVVLITPEQDGFEQEVLNSFTSEDTILAFDNDYRTFKNFGVSHIPFAVVYETKSRRVKWFGSLMQLSAEQLYDLLNLKNVKPKYL